jgi:hypothetical protein
MSVPRTRPAVRRNSAYFFRKGRDLVIVTQSKDGLYNESRLSFNTFVKILTVGRTVDGGSVDETRAGGEEGKIEAEARVEDVGKEGMEWVRTYGQGEEGGNVGLMEEFLRAGQRYGV